MLGIELLESRSLLAGDLEIAPPIVGEDISWEAAEIQLAVTSAIPAPRARVEFVLEITATDGSKLTSIRAGDEFVLRVFVRDIREDARGVFGAFLDVVWDPTKAIVGGPAQFGEEYSNVRFVDFSTPGTIDEAGALASLNPVGGGLLEVFSVQMKAVGTGLLEIRTDPADYQPVHDITVYDRDPSDPRSNPLVTDDETRFGSISILITEAEPIAEVSPTEEPTDERSALLDTIPVEIPDSSSAVANDEPESDRAKFDEKVTEVIVNAKVIDGVAVAHLLAREELQSILQASLRVSDSPALASLASPDSRSEPATSMDSARGTSPTGTAESKRLFESVHHGESGGADDENAVESGNDRWTVTTFASG